MPLNSNQKQAALLQKYAQLTGLDPALLKFSVNNNRYSPDQGSFLGGSYSVAPTAGYRNTDRYGSNAPGANDINVTGDIETYLKQVAGFDTRKSARDSQGRLAYGELGAPRFDFEIQRRLQAQNARQPNASPAYNFDKNGYFSGLQKDYQSQLEKDHPGFIQAPLNDKNEPHAPQINGFENPNTVTYDPKYGYIIPKEAYHPESPDAFTRYGPYVPLLLFGAGVAASSLAAGGAASSGASGAAGGTAGGASGTATTAIDIGAADLGGAAASGGAFGGASGGGLAASGGGLAAAGTAPAAAPAAGGLFGTNLTAGELVSGAGTLAGAGGLSGGSGGGSSGNAPAAQSNPYNADGLSPNGYDGSGIGAGLGNNGGNNNTAALDQLFNGNQSVGTPGANGSSYTLDQLFATPAVGGGQSVATGDKNLDLMLNNAYGGYKAQNPGWAGTIAQWWNTAKGTYNAAKQSGVIGGLLGGSGGNSNLGSLLGGLLTAYTAYRGAQAQEPKDKYTDYSSIQGNHVSLDPSIRNLQNESLGNTGALESGVMGYGTKFRNRSDENAGAYDKLYAELTSNQNPFIQARVDPLKGQIASRRGELQRSQGLRGVSGSSFGNDELTNFDFGASRELGNATASATQEALGARSGTLGNIGAQNTSTLAGNNSITGQLNSLNTNRTGIAGQRSAQELASLGLSDQAAQQLQQAAINKNDIYANILKGYLG